MPVQSISYTEFTSDEELRSDLKQGALNGSSKRWCSELFQHEDATRAKLLTNELVRFFCDSRQPMGLIAKDELNVFFLLTEVITEQKNQYHLIEKELVSKAVNLFFGDQLAIKITLDYYDQTIKKNPLNIDLLNRALLRLILLPRGPLYFFVKKHIQNEQEKVVFDRLSSRQIELTKQLLARPDFKIFLLSQQAEKESQKCIETLKQFTAQDGTRFVANFSTSILEEMHALQWQEIRTESREDYELSLESTTSEKSKSPKKRTPSEEEVCPFLSSVESEAFSPDLPDMSSLKTIEPTLASPVSITNQNTPTLPLIERTYTPRQNPNDRVTPLTFCSFLSSPLSCIRTAKGTPMSLIPDNMEDEAAENAPST